MKTFFIHITFIYYYNNIPLSLNVFRAYISIECMSKLLQQQQQLTENEIYPLPFFFIHFRFFMLWWIMHSTNNNKMYTLQLSFINNFLFYYLWRCVMFVTIKFGYLQKKKAFLMCCSPFVLLKNSILIWNNSIFFIIL